MAVLSCCCTVNARYLIRVNFAKNTQVWPRPLFLVWITVICPCRKYPRLLGKSRYSIWQYRPGFKVIFNQWERDFTSVKTQEFLRKIPEDWKWNDDSLQSGSWQAVMWWHKQRPSSNKWLHSAGLSLTTGLSRGVCGLYWPSGLCRSPLNVDVGRAFSEVQLWLDRMQYIQFS